MSNVTDGAATVQGSEVRNLEIRVHYVDADKGEYVPVSFSRFHFASSDPTTIYSNDYSACFYSSMPAVPRLPLLRATPHLRAPAPRA